MSCQLLMMEPPVRLKPGDSVAQAVKALLAASQPAAPVTDEAGKLLGVFGLRQAAALVLPKAARLGDELGDLAYVHESLADLAARFAAHAGEPVRRHMVEHVVAAPDTQAMEAVLLVERGDGFLPVVDGNGRLLGVVTAARALAAVSEGH
ncbi:MAG: CBS domain-containing protein [Pseudomonadota bacterium]